MRAGEQIRGRMVVQGFAAMRPEMQQVVRRETRTRLEAGARDEALRHGMRLGPELRWREDYDGTDLEIGVTAEAR